jgi:hypothetical protein
MSHKFLNPVEVDGQVSAEYLDLSTTTTHSVNAGEIAWDSVYGTFDIGLLNGVILQAGQEIHFYGKAIEAISNGDAVQFAGVQGDHLLIKKAVALEINANPEYFMGVATQDFSNNQFGYVTAFGNVRGLNTTSYNLGEILYFNSASLSVPGLLTSTKPTAPNAKIEVAAVVRVHGTQGILMVRPHVMPKVVDLQDVNSSSLTNNEGLFWNTSTNRFENKSISNALGYTPANVSHTHDVIVPVSQYTWSHANLPNSYTNGIQSSFVSASQGWQSFGSVLTMKTYLTGGGATLQMYVPYSPTYGGTGLQVRFGNYDVSTGNSWTAWKTLLASDNYQAYSYFSGDVYGTRFYDYNNTAYYLDPASSSNLYNVTANSFVKSGGTSSQFLKADGSVDSNTYLTSVTNISGYSGTLISEDNRTISPSELGANRLKFGFTSWANNNTSPYADFIHLRSYQDASGGSDNLIMFKKSGIGMRIWQQTYGSTTAYSTFKDVAFTDSDISGNAATATTLQTTRTINGTNFNGSANIETSYWGATRTLTIGNTGKTVNGSGNQSWSLAEIGAYPSTNPNGYISSYTETDTLQTVTSRGATSNVAISLSNSLTLAGFGSNSFINGTGDGSSFATYNFALSGWSSMAFYNPTVGGAFPNQVSGLIDFRAGIINMKGDFRAPIFYDSNNTSFYLDPASTSMLNALMVGGSGVVTNNGGTWGINISGNSSFSNTSSYSYFSDISNLAYSAYELNNNYTNWNSSGAGNNVVGMLGWKGYGNDYVIFDASAGTTPSGSICSQTDSDFSWTTAYPTLMGFDGISTYGVRVDRAYYADYADSANITFNNISSKTGGTGTYQTSGDFRAPIFYDSNNTGYYVDPASTSNLLSLTVANTISGSINGNSATVSNITNNTGLVRNGLSAPGFIDGLTTNNFRTTLFGSTTNGYQISTARWNNVPAPLSGLNQYSTMIAWAGSDTQGFLAVDYNSPAVRIGGGNANNINWNRRVLLEDVWTNNKYFGSNGDIYGTVFYDANDSSRYLDPSSTGDSIRVSGDIVAYYSDERLKDKKGNIQNALEKVLSLNGFYYEPNNKAQELGYKKKLEVGVSAQEVETILPEIIKDAPIGQGYKTLDYGKLTPLLIEAIKEQQKQIDELKELVNKLITK